MRAAFAVTLFAGALIAQGPPYLGPGSCNGSGCHGSSRANTDSNQIMGTEYSIWASKKQDGDFRDKHTKAYKVLGEERSRRMARLVDEAHSGGNRAKIGDPQKSPRCLACHAVGSQPGAPPEGVACEACHGLGTAEWLGKHREKTNSPAEYKAKHDLLVQKLGMTDTKDLIVRTKKCLECHLGTKDKFVDHELIAGGHPDLAFELDTFSAAMPNHWRDPKPRTPNTLPRVQVWAVGQATALAEGMKLLAIQTSGMWPEFTQLECYQCHHDLRADSWRIQRGYGGRNPGTLQPNVARYEILRVLVEHSASDRKDALESGFAQLTNLVNNHLSDGKAIGDAATSLQKVAESLSTRFAGQDFTPDAARALVKALSAEAPRIAGAGVHSAEQITMALDSLTAAYGTAPTAQSPALNPIDALYSYLEHPAEYKPADFVTLFRKAAAQTP